MPRIPQYFSDENLTPTDRGANAWENAARRIPGLYNAVASNEREAGQVRAQAFKQQLWPFDIMELYDRRAMRAAQETAAQAKRPGPDSPGARFRISGSGIGRGTSTRHWGGSAEGGGAAESQANAAIEGYGGAQQIARGASTLGNMLSDGGYSAGRRRDEGGAPGDPYAYMRPAWKAQEDYNAQRDEAVKGATGDLVETQNYWARYYGENPNQTTVSNRFSSEGRAVGYATPPLQQVPPPSMDEGPGMLSRVWSSAQEDIANVRDAPSNFSSWWTGGGAAATAPIPRE